VRILALDTATENCSAALMIDGRVLTREVELERGHAELILPMADELLAEAGITLRSLDAIAFGRGPGSFTGVRMAATVTQGLAFGADLGVVPVSDLKAVAQRAFSHDATIVRVLVCNDARMSEVYWACFERSPDGLATLKGDEHVGKPLSVALPQDWPDATAVGRGFTAYAVDLRTAVPTVFLGSDPAGAPDPTLPTDYTRFLPRAAEIVLLAVPEVLSGRLVTPEEAIPVYLRDNVAHVAQPKKPLA
jgi:tRNA threonylcarbamoyladenosine biosynthesis protein TsaB